MSFIVVIGCDGAGKSSVLTELRARLKEAGVEVAYGHWRPAPFSKNEQGAHVATADDPHGQVSRGAISSVVKLGWIWINWWVAWFLELRSKARLGHVFYDRYYGDLLVDPMRYRYGGPMWLARVWTRTLPKPDYLIFLDAEVDVLLSRKQEVPAGALERNRRAYLAHVTENKGIILNVDRPVNLIVEDLYALVGAS